MNRVRFSQERDTNLHCITVLIVGDKIILIFDPKYLYFVLTGNINCNPIATLCFLLCV